MNPDYAALAQRLRDALGDSWVVIYQGRYWRPNGGGYTDTMLMAGLYSEADAKRIEHESDRGDHAHRALDHVGDRGAVYCDQDTLIGRALAAASALDRLAAVEGALRELVTLWGLEYGLATGCWLTEGPLQMTIDALATARRALEDTK